MANFKIHYETTGPEIWRQSDQKVDIFCSAVGTGGTLAGVSVYLKEKKSSCEIVLLDPMGSGLFEYIKTGQIKSTGSSITEGIGIMRLTENFKKAQVDEALQINDEQMISMLYFVAQKEGLLIGTSAALNLFGAYQMGLNTRTPKKLLSPFCVTVLCDINRKFLTLSGLKKKT